MVRATGRRPASERAKAGAGNIKSPQTAASNWARSWHTRTHTVIDRIIKQGRGRGQEQGRAYTRGLFERATAKLCRPET